MCVCCCFLFVVVLNIPVLCASLAITTTVNRIRTKVGVISGLLSWVGLRCVIVVFPDHTHLLFQQDYSF